MMTVELQVTEVGPEARYLTLQHPFSIVWFLVCAFALIAVWSRASGADRLEAIAPLNRNSAAK